MPAHRRLPVLAVTTALAASLLLPLSSAAAPAPAPAPAPPAAAPDGPAGVPSKGDVGGLLVENSFVSSVGWVKPGGSYPSRILLTNTGDQAVSGAQVVVTAPTGTTFTAASGGATVSGDGDTVTWSPAAVEPTSTRVLVLESEADTLQELPTVVWRDISSTATVTVGGAQTTLTSHGPKVIPPGSEYDTARYGDRPFPVVPVQYTDRTYNDHARDLDTVINSPEFEGSTFNLFQEMSLGQLYPDGTVPSEGIASAGFDYAPGFDFTRAEPGQTCTGATYETELTEAEANPLYTERITDGIYNLPGQTQYYGADANGTALTGALAGVGALQAIDSGCGPTGKLVYDTAAIADPEIDYSDFDTDKDGVVDFFMAVFAGCGGNGASQLAACTDNPSDAAPYDNVWPHSSSLEFYYSDPETGLPGYTSDDQLEDLEGNPQWYTDETRTEMTDEDTGEDLKVFVRVGPYNVNPETAIDAASVISHEYGHSLGLPDFYSTGSRETYGDWNLMATDKSHNIDAYGRQELGWVVPEVLDSSRTESGITDSKQDTDTITWQRPDGTPYTLAEGQDGVGRVQNSQMYVAKLPGRILLDPAKFETGDTATPVHTWWSRSGNDFGCAKDPGKGHNLDVAIPEVADLPAGTTLSLDFKSMWDIEWDYDYGFVLTSTDGGREFTSNESENGFTTSNTDPLAGNPNQNACQQHYDNGLTGTSGSYDAGSEAVDRKAGNTPPMIYKADSYDISELVGADLPVLRFSYSTDPGLARPGWFIDDVVITATLPDGSEREIYATDFESSGDPDDPRIFNGGCKADSPGTCTQGWQYVAAGSEGPSDHAYYLELRDRSGFDVNGKGQNDRDPIGFEAGLYNAYTDEAHGYGNAGTDDPPAQSPLDSTPEPGNNTPDLNDAAWRPGDTAFSDSGEGHTDNYEDPGSADGNWHFRYDCLSYEVLSMTGQEVGPDTSDGDLTGAVDFTIGEGCGSFDYGYEEEVVGGPEDTTAPEAAFTTSPDRPFTGTTVTFDASGSSDDTTARDDLEHAWDLDNDGDTDATGQTVTRRFRDAGPHKVVLTTTDEAGNATSTGDTVLVRRLVRCDGDRVDRSGSWRVVQDERANGGRYCRSDRRQDTRDVLRLRFEGPRVVVIHGDVRGGGRATVLIDGESRRALSFRSDDRRISFGEKLAFRGLGRGEHTLRIVMTRGRGYVEGFSMRG
jgi:M6 family metalloprotease-like protein